MATGTSSATSSSPDGLSLVRRLFVEMVREEWRLHAALFGGGRFGAFPVMVAAIGVLAVQFLQWSGTPLDDVVAGFHALVLAFGLHTGTIGLVGRDALRNLLGEVNLLVFSARTLPVSQRQLLTVFLVKDAVYYAGLFLLPLSVAFFPLGPAGMAGLFGTVTATFLLGLAVTFALVAASTHGRVGTLAGLAGAAGVGLAWAGGIDVLAWTPYGLYVDPSPLGAVQGLLAIPVLALVGVLAYDTTYRKPARTATSQFRAWHDRLAGLGTSGSTGGVDPQGLVTKSLLDVARSSGGFFKVVFSGGILFGVSAFLIGLTESITGIEPSTGISFGAILGLTAFTTYNWLTQFDDPEEYLAYPVEVADLFAAKFRAFLVLGVPNGLVYFALAVVLFDADPAHVLVGVVLLLGLEAYLFGLTVYLAGFQPNEFLFDTVLFSVFGLAVAVVLVPVLIVGFVVTPIGPALLAGLALAGLLVGAVGVGAYRRAVPRWARRLRQ